MLQRPIPPQGFQPYTGYVERPWISGVPQFVAPEYPGAAVPFVGQQPRVMQDVSKQIEIMRTAAIHDETSLAIANTPLVQLKRVIQRGSEVPVARVLAKLEGGNHCQSSRLRAASAIVRESEFQPGFCLRGPSPPCHTGGWGGQGYLVNLAGFGGSKEFSSPLCWVKKIQMASPADVTPPPGVHKKLHYFN